MDEKNSRKFYPSYSHESTKRQRVIPPLKGKGHVRSGRKKKPSRIQVSVRCVLRSIQMSKFNSVRRPRPVQSNCPNGRKTGDEVADASHDRLGFVPSAPTRCFAYSLSISAAAAAEQTAYLAEGKGRRGNQRNL